MDMGCCNSEFHALMNKKSICMSVFLSVSTFNNNATMTLTTHIVRNGKGDQFVLLETGPDKSLHGYTSLTGFFTHQHTPWQRNNSRAAGPRRSTVAA